MTSLVTETNSSESCALGMLFVPYCGSSQPPVGYQLLMAIGLPRNSVIMTTVDHASNWSCANAARIENLKQCVILSMSYCTGTPQAWWTSHHK
jgi:hypothetical protein